MCVCWGGGCWGRAPCCTQVPPPIGLAAYTTAARLSAVRRRGAGCYQLGTILTTGLLTSIPMFRMLSIMFDPVCLCVISVRGSCRYLSTLLGRSSHNHSSGAGGPHLDRVTFLWQGRWFNDCVNCHGCMALCATTCDGVRDGLRQPCMSVGRYGTRP